MILEPEKFLSTENDLQLVALFVAAILLLVFAGEALAGDRPNPGYQPPKGAAPLKKAAKETKIENITQRVPGHTGEGQTSTVPLSFNGSVLRLSVTLTWTDDYGSNDDFGLALKLDGNKLQETRGTSGKLEVSAWDGSRPMNGTLSVEVTAISCPGVVPGSPVDRDSGNDWTTDVLAAVKS